MMGLAMILMTLKKVEETVMMTLAILEKRLMSLQRTLNTKLLHRCLQIPWLI